MAGSPIASLSDDFENNIIDPAWISGPSGSGTVSESGGQARCALPSNTAGSHSAYYRSTGTYDLTGDGFSIDIATMVSTSVAASMTFDAFLDGSNVYRWLQSNGTLTARKIVAGVNTQLYTVAWNASTFRYLRIRESGGTVFFDSSSDGSSWTNRATQTVAGAFAVTDLTIQFGAFCGNVASPGTLVINDVNLLSLATTWRWVEVRREYSYRLGGITIAATSGVGYIATAQSIDSSGNLVSPRYFAGPQNSGRALVEYATQAAAQAMAVALPIGGRWDMPAGVYVEARYVRLYIRSSTGSNFTVREYYPRRLIQSDDIEAESIKAINIAAASITADKLAVLQLSAITGDVGTLTAGTIDGVIITFGAGAGTLNSTGLHIKTAASKTALNSVRFDDSSSGNLSSAVYGVNAGSENQVIVSAGNADSRTGVVQLEASPSAGSLVTLKLDAAAQLITLTSTNGVILGDSSFDNGNIELSSQLSGDRASAVDFHSDDSWTDYALRLVRAAGTNGSTIFAHRGTGNFDIQATDAAAMRFLTSSAVRISLSSGGSIGFFGSVGSTKPTVTGSRGGNAALGSLLLALSALGLLTDSSS